MSRSGQHDEARPILIIGYGSRLHRDDGVGPRAAEAVACWGLPGVAALALHQLTPELAEPLAASRLAVFVDARLASPGETAQVEPIGPRGGDAAGHLSSPRALLALARAAFGGGPEAWVVTIPATDLGLGERLSPTAARGLEDALAAIGRLLGERGVHRPAAVGLAGGGPCTRSR